MDRTLPDFVPNPIPENEKERIYDEQISPLVQQMLQIAMDNGIHCLMDFNLGAGLRCTSLIPGTEEGKEGRANDKFQNECMKILKPATPPPVMMEITGEDGSKTLMAIVG